MIVAKIGSILGLLSFSNPTQRRYGPVIESRDMNEPTILPIPIKSSFQLAIGNSTTGSAQSIRVLPSTSFSWIVAINPVGCGGDSPDDCENSRGNFYNPNSTGALPLGGTFLESFSGFQEPQIQGYLYSDSVSFPDTPGTIHANSPTILNIAQIDYWVGLLPLNPTKNSVSDPSNKHPSLLECLKRDRQIPSLSWGYTAGAKYKSIAAYGSLTLGGYDNSRIDNTTSSIQGSLTDDPAQDFAMTLASITTDTNELTILTDSNLKVVLDSTLPYLYFTSDLCQSFADKLNLTLNDTVGLYLMSQDDKDRLSTSIENMTFVLRETSTSNSGAAVKFVFPIAAFILNVSLAEIDPTLKGWSWYFPLKTKADSTMSTLGRVFLQEAYLIADYERKKFNISPVHWPDDLVYTKDLRPIHPVDASNEGGSSSLSKGALAGAIVGGIIGGLILACIFLQLYRRRQRNHRRLSSKSAPPSYIGAHTSEASIAGGRSRASSRIASLFPFRNPWSGSERGYEPPQDPGYVVPPEGEEKGPLGNELDANTTGVYEMYQPKRIIPEVEGDTSYPANGLAPGAVGGNARTSSSSIDPHTTVEGDGEAKPVNVFEMEANSLDPNSQGPSPMPTPSLPSPSSAEAAERHVLAENQRQERPEPGDRRTSGQSTVSAPSPYTMNERRVSDRSFVSLSVFSDAGTGTLGSIFADHPFSTPSGVGGSEAPSNVSTERGNEPQEGSGGSNPGIDGDGASRSGAAPEADASGKQSAQAQTQQPQTRRPSASVLSRSLSARSRSGSEGPPVNLGAITEDREHEGAAWTKTQ
ncbi:aspartic peptidase domain-containing protein [Phyllosticta capitalensis]|uniref:aspartic peptidase domain-containing protein n=1 Tax=Phyllosticta capitalensis TaxID=121624 RepID=UPI00313297EC